jgi:AAA family ATP:ADP antiporter
MTAETKHNTNRFARAIVASLLITSTTFAFQTSVPRVALSTKAIHPFKRTHASAPALYESRSNELLSSSRLSMSSVVSSATEGDRPARKSLLDRLKSMLPPAAERQKLLPLALMFFCILFNYTILRDTKDVLMVTAPKSGAEVIPFLKTYVNLPTAIAFTGIYAKLTDTMELKNVFYAFVIPFLMFFTAFAFFIYPNQAFLHPHALVDSLAAVLPANFGAPLSIIRNWSFALFYVMAEMWGSMVASLLFWGFANEVTTVDEAKKYCKFQFFLSAWLTVSVDV